MPDVDGPRREPIAVFIVGIVVGAVVLGVAWLAFSGLHSNHASDPAAPTTESPLSTQSPASKQQVTIARVQRCAAVYVAQDAPLKAADAAMNQWEIHVGAMNKLVTGAITLHQANQFWNSTRVGAKANLDQFAQARQVYAQRTDHCPERWTATGDGDLKKCRAAVAARNHALRLAEVALKTWNGHVMSMEMLRDGKLSPQRAENMWIRSWTRGNKQVHAYTHASTAAQKLSC